MDVERSRSSQGHVDTVRRLAEGIDPQSGEEFPADSPYQHPRVIRALCAAAAALEQHEVRRRRQSRRPDRAGSTWTDEEDARLLAAFDAAKSLREIASGHDRSVSAVRARLVKLGRLEAEDLTLR